VLRIIDNGGILIQREATQNGGGGLNNTDARLLQICGSRQFFLLHEDKGQTIAEVVLPFYAETGREVA
jgi:hypothetical protein